MKPTLNGLIRLWRLAVSLRIGINWRSCGHLNTWVAGYQQLAHRFFLLTGFDWNLRLFFVDDIQLSLRLILLNIVSNKQWLRINIISSRLSLFWVLKLKSAYLVGLIRVPLDSKDREFILLVHTLLDEQWGSWSPLRRVSGLFLWRIKLIFNLWWSL